MRRALACVIAALLLGAAPAHAGWDVPHEIGGSWNSIGPTQVEGPQARILRNASDVRALLTSWGLLAEVPHLDGVDFARRAVIVAVDDLRNTGGYRAHVLTVAVTAGTATVTVVVEPPKGGAADVETRPWVVATVPRAKVAGAGPMARVRLWPLFRPRFT